MARLITEGLVHAITGDVDRWYQPLDDACSAWEIDVWLRVSMFLAQCAHESAGFTRLVESLKYSAKGLRRTWPSRFSEEDATRMAYRSSATGHEDGTEWAIGERAYGGRMGNRPEGSGDGFNNRGRGIIQITGANNLRAMGEHLGADLVAEPQLLEHPLWAAYASACFWDTNGCSEAADDDDYERVTRIINGGLNGWDDRVEWLVKVNANRNA